MICHSCKKQITEEVIHIKSTMFHPDCAYAFADLLFRAWEVLQNQHGFAAKQQVSNVVQKALFGYKSGLEQAKQKLYRQYYGEMWDKPEPEPEQPKKKRGYEWL